MATVIEHTIKPDGTGDYLSLAAWQTAQVRDLVAVDEIARAVCHPGSDTTAFVLQGWTTDATRRVEIVAAPGFQATAQWQPTSAVFTLQPNAQQALRVLQAHSIVDGIQVETTVNFGTIRAVDLGSGSNGSIARRVHARIPAADPASSPTAFFVFAGAGQTVTVEHCVGHKTGGAKGNGFTTSGVGTQNLLNCTASDCPEDGFEVGSGAVLKNCLAFNCGVDFSGTPAAASDFNASEDATAPGANSVTGIADPFVDRANDDFRLAAGAAPVDAGTDLSASTSVDTDIAGTARPEGAAWDIGAHELVAAGPSGNLPLLQAIGEA